MKAYYPILKGITYVILFSVATFQEFMWLHSGHITKSNWFSTLLWLITKLGLVVYGVESFFKIENPQTKHRFVCTFYGFHRNHVRVCKRTYDSVLTFCFKQLIRSRSFFFIIKEQEKS